MESKAQPRQISSAAIVVGAAAIAFAIVGGWFLTRPPQVRPEAGPSAEAKAYLSSLHLSDVTLKAADNLMQQRVVYIDGKITNGGSRSITRIDIYCVFTDVNGREVYRERVPVVHGTNATPFGPDQTRSFELPFDNLPDTWNQGLPHLVVAEMQFAK